MCEMKLLMAALSMFVCGCLTAVSQAPAASPPFKVCDNEYALCTFSECGEVIGQQPTVTCKCRVQVDKSVGTECAGPNDARRRPDYRQFPVSPHHDLFAVFQQPALGDVSGRTLHSR